VTIGVICEAFHCLPSEAMNENWAVIREILDYRMLVSAREQHNQDASHMHPSQVAAWTEMVEAVDSNG